MDGFFKKLIGSLFFLKNILKKTSDVQPHKKALGKKGEVVAAKFLKKRDIRYYRGITGVRPEKLILFAMTAVPLFL